MIRIFKSLGIFLMLLACSQDLLAQGRVITGTVTSGENKQPLAGVTVAVKGTRNAVTTNAEGKFRITVDNNATALVFSSATFLPYEVAIGTQTTIDTELQPDTKALSDVVVIGYQTVRRKDLLASVSSVGAKDLKDIPINSAAEALNGRLAGVTATTAEGSPDADIRIRVRGGMSIT